MSDDELMHDDLLDDGPPPERSRWRRVLAGVLVVGVGLLVWHQASGSGRAPSAPTAAHSSSPHPTSALLSKGTAHPGTATVHPGTPMQQADPSQPTPLPDNMPALPAENVVAAALTGDPVDVTMTDSWVVVTGVTDARPRHSQLTVFALPEGSERRVGAVTFPDGGMDTCPQILLDEWLTWTEVSDQPADNTASPGPPVAWRLHAMDLRTGRQRVLDHGMRDAMLDDVCVRNLGGSAAWQRPDGSWHRWQPWSSAPPETLASSSLAGFQTSTPEGELYVRDHDEIDSDLIWQVADQRRLVPVATVPHLTAVGVFAQHLVWSSGIDGGADVVGTVSACTLPTCAGQVQLANVPAWKVAVGSDIAAWSSGSTGSVLNIRTWDGRWVQPPPELLVGPQAVAAYGNRVAAVVRTHDGPLLRVYTVSL